MPYPVSAVRNKNFGTLVIYSISGTVFDADGTTAVSGATVSIGSLSTTSAANGTYTLSNVPAGTSGSMTCTKSGYVWTAKTISSLSGNLTGQNYTNVLYASGGSSASAVAYYRAIGAASYAASKVNIANPGTNDAVEGGGALTFDASYGWLNDVSKYFRLTFQPANTWTFLVRFSEYTGAFTTAFGLSNAGGTQVIQLAPIYLGTVLYQMGGANQRQVAPDVTSGVFGIAGNQGYRNGVADGATFVVGTVPALEMYLFGYNQNGTAANIPVTKMQAFAAWNTTLDSTQMGIASAAMAALANP